MYSYIKGNARFSAVSDGAVRIEYAKNAAFTDEETLFAVRENHCTAEFCDSGDTLTVTTPKLTLTYKGEGPFSPDNLFCHVHTDGVDALWHYGDKAKNNLGGTLVTLDGVSKREPLPDGIVSRDGFYVFDDSKKPVIIDGQIADRPTDHETDLYFFAYGTNYKAAIKDLALVAGTFELPRRCVFGSWYSRWWRYTAEDFISLVDEYDQNGFPLDVMVMDMDWHYQDWGHSEGEPYPLYGYGHCGQNLGWTGYSWNKTIIPDPKGLLSELGARGIKAVLNDHPADGLRDHEDTYPGFMKELFDKGYTEEVAPVEALISEREKANSDRDVLNFRFNAGSPVYMDAFFKHALTPVEEDGVEFWWLDWQQDYIYPTVNGIKDLPHLPWLNRLYYQHSKIGGKRGASFSRWGGIGDHKHPAYFSGDAVSGWETLAFEIEMTATAANAGCFWWSHDIGGFIDPVPGGQAENYTRWVQFGALSSTLRLHMNGVEGFDRRPWTWGEPYCSAMKEAFLLRSRLFCYIYSSAYFCAAEPLPFIRPLYYECPLEEQAYLHPTTYFLGKDLIVSPVCVSMEGKDTVKTHLWLPDGVWFHLFTNERYEKGNITVESTLSTFPLFVRANTPLITQPYRSRMTSHPYDDITVNVFCDGEGAACSALYEDDGETEDYKKGKARITTVEYQRCGTQYVITLSPSGAFDGAVERRSLTVALHNTAPLICTSADAEVSYDAKSRTSKVRMSSVSADERLTVVLTESDNADKV